MVLDRGGQSLLVLGEAMTLLDSVLYRFNVVNRKPYPIEIPNAGRNDLAKFMGDMGLNQGAEIGVHLGLFSKVLCESNLKLQLHCVDPWRAYTGYVDYSDSDKLNRAFAYARKLLQGHSVHFLRMSSRAALEQFKDGSLDFVYIDGNHELSHVVFDLVHWSKKVRSGGIIAGHDYKQPVNAHNGTHVIEGVQAVVSAYSINPWFVLGTKMETFGQTREAIRSFFWVKP
jgi:hypothetical protein